MTRNGTLEQENASKHRKARTYKLKGLKTETETKNKCDYGLQFH